MVLMLDLDHFRVRHQPPTKKHFFFILCKSFLFFGQGEDLAGFAKDSLVFVKKSFPGTNVLKKQNHPNTLGRTELLAIFF